ncbi:MAG: hypothetical protein J6M21_04015 [Campylobacter sp.]|nr:hypothetical protein [Campylobacter sp.]
MLSKESNDAFMFGIREALEKRDIVGFEALIKGYMSLSSNPDENYTYSDEFLDIMIQNKDIQAFKILKNLNFDKFEVIGSETTDSTDFIQYLNRQKADKEILKIFK